MLRTKEWPGGVASSTNQSYLCGLKVFFAMSGGKNCQKMAAVLKYFCHVRWQKLSENGIKWHRVTQRKTPRRGKTPHHDISELKLFEGNFFCSILHTICGQNTGKNNVPAISRQRNIGKKCVFRAFFSVFGFSFQVAAILHTIMQFSIFHTYREIVGRAQSYPPIWSQILVCFQPRRGLPSELLIGVKRHCES